MRIPLDLHSAAPLYQQIVDHLRQQILAGALAAETRLPATRQLAHEPVSYTHLTLPTNREV